MVYRVSRDKLRAHKRKNREAHGVDFSVEVGLCSLS